MRHAEVRMHSENCMQVVTIQMKSCGIEIIVWVVHIPLGSSSRTNWGFMIWAVMYGNGVKIGMEHIVLFPKSIPLDPILQLPIAVSYEAVAGHMTQITVV